MLKSLLWESLATVTRRFSPAGAVTFGWLVGCTADAEPTAHEDAGGPTATLEPRDAAVATKPVELRFGAFAGETQLDCGGTSATLGSTARSIALADLRFYVSDVRLIDEDGRSVPVTLEEAPPYQGGGVALIDLEDGTGACTDSGDGSLNARVTGQVPEGEYRALSFSMSVPVELNHADPSTLPAPLQAGQMSWGWMSGYKFLKLELLDVVGEAGGEVVFGNPTSLHLGSAACNTPAAAAPDPTQVEIICGIAARNRVELDSFDLDTSVVAVNLERFLEPVDLSRATLCHPFGSETCSVLMERAGIDPVAGTALDSQFLFELR